MSDDLGEVDKILERLERLALARDRSLNGEPSTTVISDDEALLLLRTLRTAMLVLVRSTEDGRTIDHAESDN